MSFIPTLGLFVLLLNSSLMNTFLNQSRKSFDLEVDCFLPCFPSSSNLIQSTPSKFSLVSQGFSSPAVIPAFYRPVKPNPTALPVCSCEPVAVLRFPPIVLLDI